MSLFNCVLYATMSCNVALRLHLVIITRHTHYLTLPVGQHSRERSRERDTHYLTLTSVCS